MRGFAVNESKLIKEKFRESKICLCKEVTVLQRYVNGKFHCIQIMFLRDKKTFYKTAYLFQIKIII